MKSSATSTCRLIVAPYVSPQAAAICQQEGFGFVDLAGNCLLNFGSVFISKEGKENPFSQKRDLKSLYSPKAERVLRVLLSNPRRWWKGQFLARDAGVSLGLGFNAKKLLADREWLENSERGFRLQSPEKLLAEWEQNYDSTKNAVHQFYSVKPIAEVERLLAETCAQNKLVYALAGFSSATRYAPMVGYQRAMAYVEGEVEMVAKSLDLKPVTSGANVNIIEPRDLGVFYAIESRGGAMVTSLIQTYLDLRQLKGRGDEAADFLKQQIIDPAWQERVLALVEEKHELAVSGRDGSAVATINPLPMMAETGSELADLWPKLDRLPEEEAAAFADDIESGRANIPPVQPEWD